MADGKQKQAGRGAIEAEFRESELREAEMKVFRACACNERAMRGQ